jgi:hypothetical protein
MHLHTGSTVVLHSIIGTGTIWGGCKPPPPGSAPGTHNQPCPHGGPSLRGEKRLVHTDCACTRLYPDSGYIVQKFRLRFWSRMADKHMMRAQNVCSNGWLASENKKKITQQAPV